MPGLEKAVPIDVSLFQVGAANGLDVLGAVGELFLGVLGQASGVDEDTVGEVFRLRVGQEGVYLALGDVLVAAKEFTLDCSICIYIMANGGGG